MKKTYTYEIERDGYVSNSPREWDNITELLFPNVNFGDSRDSIIDRLRKELSESDIRQLFCIAIAGLELSTIRETIESCNYDYFDCLISLGHQDSIVKFAFAICQPVYMYDHGGQTIRTSPFSCSWDSGCIGHAIVTHEAIKREGLSLEQAQKRLESEIKILDQYLTGDVWGYRIFENYEEIDSCWGFYGYEYCEQEAQELVAHYEKKALHEHFNRVKNWIRNRVPLQYRGI